MHISSGGIVEMVAELGVIYFSTHTFHFVIKIIEIALD